MIPTYINKVKKTIKNLNKQKNKLFKGLKHLNDFTKFEVGSIKIDSYYVKNKRILFLFVNGRVLVDKIENINKTFEVKTEKGYTKTLKYCNRNDLLFLSKNFFYFLDKLEDYFSKKYLELHYGGEK